MNDVEIRLLGPVEVVSGGLPVGVGPAQQQLLLAALAAEPGRPVPVDALVDRVWDDVPTGARRTLPVLVSRLRRMVAPAQVPHRSGSYLLDVDPERVDVHRMRLLADRARDPALSAADRAGLLRTAIGLWRGAPLTGLTAGWADRIRQIWWRQYVDVVVAWGAAEMAVDNAGPVVLLARALLGEHPLEEALIAVQMRALAASGRPTEALTVFAAARERLADELGVDPGTELAELHQAVLRGEPVAPPPVADRPVPAQLPADVPGFAGRDEHLARLDALLAAGPAAVVISALSGTAGVGKTALAVHWAHRVADRFPDGQLYVNLRGFAPDGRLVSPAEALADLLDALGVPADRLPARPDERAALYRSLVAGKRLLVLLDNARDAEHVRLLLPGAPPALALITSRAQLAGLVATHGARWLAVDLLTTAESTQLLARRLGADRVAAEPAAVAEIVDRCARLPLALTLVAARADAEPGSSLAELAAELAVAGRRLDALDVGDTATEPRGVFSWSYRALSGPAARLFRLVGLHPGPELSVTVAADLAGVRPDAVRAPLAELGRASLLAGPTAGRYRCHDLLHDYARDLAVRTDSADDRRATVGRLLDHYGRTALASTLVLHPYRSAPVLPLDPTRSAGLIADRADAAAWLGAELTTLAAAAGRADAAKLDARGYKLAWAVALFIEEGDCWNDLARLGRLSLAATDRIDAPAARAYGHFLISLSDGRFGRHAAAERQLRAALALYRDVGDAQRPERTRGDIAPEPVRPRPSAHRFGADRAAVDRPSQAQVLTALAWCHAELGNYIQALADCAEALVLPEDLGDADVTGRTLDSLGYLLHQLGRYGEAADSYRRSIAIRRSRGVRRQEADTLVRLGDTRLAAGEPAGARSAWQSALAVLDELDDTDPAPVRDRLAGLDR
jgi:DNA-binding SARP family transcriptional activator/tetratricopeptide (TPR) repeat protein